MIWRGTNGVGTDGTRAAAADHYGQFPNYESIILEFESNEFLNKGGGLS